jgi:UDP-N-acetylglucosamine--N-acetylmuramyl-(pentapeptide) pyrophosphoryl-undecaprenol N-acetylglucosamine transferase
VFTGTPVRGDFETNRHGKRRGARSGIAPETAVSALRWGSLGSDYMNGVMPAYHGRVCREAGVCMLHSRWQTRVSEARRGRCGACGGDPAAGGVDLRRIHRQHAGWSMAAVDLVICRSGASTLGEACAAARGSRRC